MPASSLVVGKWVEEELLVEGEEEGKEARGQPLRSKKVFVTLTYILSVI